MTQLPVKLREAVEAQALAYAKQRVIWFRDNTHGWFGPHSVLSQETAHAFARQHLKQRALEHPNYMLQIIEKARAGYEDAREAMVGPDGLANDYLHRNEVMPPPLATFQMEWNAGLIRKRPAQDKVSNSMRNWAIAHMVWELCIKFGLEPTRTSSRRHSGCSILAIALASELPRGMIKPGEKAVQTIWKEWRLLVMNP